MMWELKDLFGAWIAAVAAAIQAVTARIRTGLLKVNARRCPNLVRESRLYCYDKDGSETPVDDENHALAALRYLIARLKPVAVSR